ncbi:acyl-CoA dehydrogenase family protein [Paenibacillus glacialis]|uniref:Acyl-CoA dehydrogenase/oxidase C-terminal domain-containing protein n=1 Tax=Paenibacillus glacialis TaxID=494026 RepID=A0A162M9Y2_9BACL|nr:acyl-CoA dehydrogenase family protein [Paenibacillus glacialis]OAB33775.1 hypothetical protein PGLA_22845 [Paenibacillus glacialis]
MNTAMTPLINLLNEIDPHKGVKEIVEELIRGDFNKFPISEWERLTTEDFFRIVRKLSSTHSSLSLSFSMHLYTVWGLCYAFSGEKREWLKEVVGKDYLFSSLNEPGLYFVNPGQVQKEQYPLTVTKVRNGYLLNGIKKYVSLEPFVRYLPVYCQVEGYSGSNHGIIALIVDKQSEGVQVMKDWDAISMNQTYSNSIVFNDVFLPEFNLIADENTVIEQTEILGYFYRLTIMSVYFGMAEKAIQYITDICKIKKVPHTNTRLSHFPGVQFSLSEMIIRKEASEAIILKYCKELNDYLKKPKAPHNLKTVSLAAKEFVTRSAEEIVHLAMKIEGIESLFPNSMLSELHTDIKAGRFHPPQMDVLNELIAKEHLGIISYKKRWC